MVAPQIHHRFAFSGKGFSLLELLVAMAVLSLLVVIIAQIVTGATATTKISRKRVTADDEVRRIFDRMSDDFSAMLDRPDADFLVKKTAGNDEIYLFAEAPARTTSGGISQPVSLVGYRISTQQLERFTQGLSWSGAPPDGAVFLTYSSANPDTATSDPDPASTIQGAYSGVLSDSSKFHVLGEGVFRMEISFLLRPQTAMPAKFSNSPFRNGGSSPFVNKGKGLADVQAIVVTLVVLDADSRTIVKDMTSLADRFADGVEGSTPSDAWQAIAKDPKSMGIPIPAAGNLRVYQRTFPLSKYLPSIR